jgi:hypothetical protein
VASIMYTVVTPMLNPFIDSMKNRDISTTCHRHLIHDSRKYVPIHCFLSSQKDYEGNKYEGKNGSNHSIPRRY